MNQIMQRPLFRQMGGPAQPMAQDMQAPIQQAEAEGEAIGQEVATRTMDNIDSATDVKSAIDALRGNSAPLEARYQELAGFVGERDAAQTPESVLALTQPAIMMTEQGALDSGIGELMQKLEGNTPMTQGMDSGLGALMMQGAGNTPPQNFRQGGPVVVQGFQTGGIAERAKALQSEFLPLYQSISGSPEQREAELEKDRKMARSQMLFDIAKAGLAFAGETQGSSVAERLANALNRAGTLDSISQRAGGMRALEKQADAEDKATRSAALSTAIGEASSQVRAQEALALAQAKQDEETIKDVPLSIWNTLDEETKNRILLGKESTVNGVPLSIYETLTDDQKLVVLNVKSKEAGVVKGIPLSIFERLTTDEKNRVLMGDPQGVNGVPRDIYDKLTDTEKKGVLGVVTGPVKGVPFEVYEKLTAQQQERLLLGDPQGVNGVPMSIFNTLSDEEKKAVLGVAKDVKGVPMSVYEKLTPDEQKRLLLGDPQGVNGVPRDIYNKLSVMAQKKVLGTGDDPIRGLPREIFNSLSEDEQKRFILGDEAGVKGIPRDIYDKLSADAQALIVDPVAQAEQELAAEIAREDRAELREQNRYLQDRADQIADFDKRVNAEIDKENRELNRTLDAEARAMLYFEKRLLLQQIADVDAEERALKRELSAEERANIEARARLNLQEEMKIRAEIRALKNRDNIEVREVDGQLVVFDKTKPDQEPTVVFGEASVPDPEYRAFTLEQNGKVIQVVEDINTTAGKALLAKVNEQQAAGKASNMQRISTATTRPQGYLIPEKGVFMSYDGGKTYVDDEGVRQNMPGTAQSVSDTISYEVHKTERLRANAIKTLEELDTELIAGGDFTEDEQRLVRNAYESARKGTGLWSKVLAGVDAVVGGVTGKKVAVETQDARQFVRMVRVLGRSALSVSPRFAVADLATTEQLFPNEQTLIANPQTEARKLLLLKKEINLEKTRILSKIASGDPISKTDMATFNQKLFEIDRLNKMLGPIDTIFSNVGTNEINPEAQRIFNEALQQGQGTAGDRAGVNN